MAIDVDLINENSTGYQLLQNFAKTYQEKDFEIIVGKFAKLTEKDKYRNWYNFFLKDHFRLIQSSKYCKLM